jgi:uncharacterized membrane protein YbhN (UPF0104 family)
MKDKIKYIFLVLGLLSFLYMIYTFGIGNILFNLNKVGWYFIPIMITWAFVYLFNAAAWKLIINKPDLSYTKILNVTISGYALNYMTPFFHLGGEPYRVLFLKNILGTTRAVSVTISYLMLHFLSSFLIWITAVVLILLLIPLSVMEYSIFLISLIVFGYVVFLFIKGYKNGVTKLFASFIIKLPLFSKFGSRVEKRYELLNDIDENTKELYHNRKTSFLTANILEYFSRVIATVEYYFILKALGFHPDLLETFIINAGLGLISNIFFIVPFELGVKEGGLYVMLGFLHFTPALGIFVGIVIRLRELFWIMVGLLLIMVSGNRQINKNLDTIFNE